MKKFNILAALAAFAMLVTSFTGCVTAHPDDESLVDLSTFSVLGEWNSFHSYAEDGKTKTSNLVASSETTGEWTYTFVPTAESQAFEIAPADESWSVEYAKGRGNVTYADDALAPGLTLGEKDNGFGSKNDLLSGLKANACRYKMTIQARSTTLHIKKIEEGEALVPTFFIVGNKSLSPMSYADGSYTYGFEATGASESFTIYSNGVYYAGNITADSADVESGKLTTRELSASSEDTSVVTVSGISSGDYCTISISEKNAKTVVSAQLKAPLTNIKQLKGSFGDPIAVEMKVSGNNATWETTITLAADYKDVWNDGNQNTISFGALVEADVWDGAYKDGEITLDGDFAELTAGGGGNNKITSTSALAGKKVKITLSSTATKMRCKAEIVE